MCLSTPTGTAKGRRNSSGGRKEAEKKGFNVLIVDTAGRLQIDEELMEELARVKKQSNLMRYCW